MEQRLEQPEDFPVGTAVKLVIGLFLISVGVLLTLGNFGLVHAGAVLRLWPLVLMIIGALMVAGRSTVVFGVILMIAGAWMTAFNVGWIRFTIFDFWPLLIIAFGVGMVGRAFGWRIRSAVPAPAGSSWAILASRNVIETSQAYEGSDAFAFLGGSRIDLTGARFAGGRAVIDATAIMGGVEIIVPEGCDVVGEVVPVMGGFEIKTHSGGPRSAGQLVVRGVAFMGHIEVKSGRTV